MSDEIQRYEHNGMCGMPHEKDPDGQWVKFSDHARQLQQAREEATKAERDRWNENEGGRLIDAADRVWDKFKGLVIPGCQCETCRVLRTLYYARDAVVEARQKE